MTTWRELLSDSLSSSSEGWNDVVFSTLSAKQAEVRFYAGGGEGECKVEGSPFTVWTKTRVYFPVRYDGCESVASVPRHPCDEATEHIGGG